MRTLSTASLIEKNKLATASAWLILLEVELSTSIRVVNTNEDVTWNSQTWQAFPFELDTAGETGKGEIPSIVVKISNVTGEIQRMLEAANGADGSPVTIRVINTDTTSSTVPEYEQRFILENSDYNEQWITFRLSGSNCLTRRIPRRRYLKNFCPFPYGAIECGISAATKTSFPTCDRTFAQCQQRGNSGRFGGFKWMPEL